MLVVSGVSSRGGRGQRGRGPRYQSEPRPIRHHRTVDRLDFLDAHNRVRANVTPPAANMLVMVSTAVTLRTRSRPLLLACWGQFLASSIAYSETGKLASLSGPGGRVTNGRTVLRRK